MEEYTGRLVQTAKCLLAACNGNLLSMTDGLRSRRLCVSVECAFINQNDG